MEKIINLILAENGLLALELLKSQRLFNSDTVREIESQLAEKAKGLYKEIPIESFVDVLLSDVPWVMSKAEVLYREVRDAKYEWKKITDEYRKSVIIFDDGCRAISMFCVDVY